MAPGMLLPAQPGGSAAYVSAARVWRRVFALYIISWALCGRYLVRMQLFLGRLRSAQARLVRAEVRRSAVAALRAARSRRRQASWSYREAQKVSNLFTLLTQRCRRQRSCWRKCRAFGFGGGAQQATRCCCIFSFY